MLPFQAKVGFKASDLAPSSYGLYYFFVAAQKTPINEVWVKTKYYDLFKGKTFPDDQLCKEISELGENEISALTDILEDDSLTDSEDTFFYPYLAAQILSHFKKEKALPGIVRLLDFSEIEDISALIPVLSVYGDRMTSFLVEKYPAADTLVRESYAYVLSKSGIKNGEILATLIQELNFGSDLSPMYLADYGDPAALPALSEKFNQLNLNHENLFFNHIFSEFQDAIIRLGGKLSPEQEKKLRRAKSLLNKMANIFRSRLIENSERSAAKKTGRNEPCTCGSGKKFKKCCLNKNPGPILLSNEEPDIPEYIEEEYPAELLLTDPKIAKQVHLDRSHRPKNKARPSPITI